MPRSSTHTVYPFTSNFEGPMSSPSIVTRRSGGNRGPMSPMDRLSLDQSASARMPHGSRLGRSHRRTARKPTVSKLACGGCPLYPSANFERSRTRQHVWKTLCIPNGRQSVYWGPHSLLDFPSTRSVFSPQAVSEIRANVHVMHYLSETIL